MRIKCVGLLLSIGVIVLTGCGAVAPRFTMDAAQVDEAAAEIADFELPAGYAPDYTAGWQDIVVVGYRAGAHSHLIFAQVPEGSEWDALSAPERLREVAPDDNEDYSAATVVEERTVTIQGQERTLIVAEGVNGADEPYRQVTARFEGRGGPAFVNLVAPVAEWDWATVDALLASIEN